MEWQLQSGDLIVLLASDGIWDFITDQYSVDLVSPFYPNNALRAAERLANESWDRWIQNEKMADDITALVIFIKLREELYIPEELA